MSSITKKTVDTVILLFAGTGLNLLTDSVLAVDILTITGGNLIDPQVFGVGLYNHGNLIITIANHNNLIAPVTECQPDIDLLTPYLTEGEFLYFDDCI